MKHLGEFMEWKSIAVAVLIGSCGALAKAQKVVTHVVTEAETPWFLATVYYGSGPSFSKILETNHLQRPDDMKEGMKVRIEDPKYSEDQSGFSERYKRLWQARQTALGLTVGNKLPNSKIIIPADHILHQDRTPKLPFSEHQEPPQSATEMAD
jgi:hypothetical protein